MSWIEKMHNLAAVNLEADLRAAIRAAGEPFSISVATGFVHGNPFKIDAAPPVSRAVEAGDVMFVAERLVNDGGFERQALLLQMKVGAPRQGLAGGSSTAQQACSMLPGRR